MVKKQVSRNELVKVVIFVILATVIIFGIVAFLVTRGSHAPAVSGHSSEGKATIKGIATCLPHKDTGGSQTMECAIGLKSDKGEYYSLSDKDSTYSNISLIQTGKQYEITGNLEERSDPKYQTAGILRVDSLKSL